MPPRLVGKAVTRHRGALVGLLLEAEQSDDVQFVVFAELPVEGHDVVPYEIEIATFAPRRTRRIDPGVLLRHRPDPFARLIGVVLGGKLALERQPLDGLDLERCRYVGIEFLTLADVVLSLYKGIDLARRRLTVEQIRSVRIVGTDDRGQQVGVQQGVVRALVRVILREVRREAHLHFLRYAVLETDVGREAFERLLADHAVVERIAQSDRIGSLLRAARTDKAVVGHDGRRRKLAQPVVILPVADALLLGIGQEVGTRERRIAVLLAPELYPVVHVLHAVAHVADHVGNARRSLHADRPGVVKAESRLLAAPLGRDDHHAIGSARTIDGTRRGILEDVYRLDVRSIQVSHARLRRHAVDHVERFVREVERIDAADLDAHVGTRTVRALIDQHTADSSVERLADIRIHGIDEFFAADALDRTRKVFFLHRTVADHHNVVHHVSLLLQNNFEKGPRSYDDRLRDIAQIGELEFGLRSGLNRKSAVGIRNPTGLFGDIDDAGTDQRHSRCIRDPALDLDLLAESRNHGHPCAQKGAYYAVV